ncbi:Uma2 family endonuclease [Streptomyces sp. MST-110588]|uniref:Uma2 family endonuclease n=1 Tax=Streptomyces sp. MST-110588 TaxID=2833628 RepID=UPI001F5C3681|nr:Uma2 family endonuclease [Streptomyces sp. MST-110588]UNO41333.1 Uma2 family endonuclease [Streptomyces sp. MST-110588]
MDDITTDEPQRPWAVPPPGGYGVEEFFGLPGLPRHAELIDGGVVVAAPRRAFDSVAQSLLWDGLRRTAPGHLRVRGDMAVVLGDRDVLEPDVLVVRAVGAWDPRRDRYDVADVVLAGEVISPDSERRDRKIKPGKYARAGIPYFWLVEMVGEDDHAAVHTYELDAVTQSYGVTGVHHQRLKTTVPYAIDIDLTQIYDA